MNVTPTAVLLGVLLLGGGTLELSSEEAAPADAADAPPAPADSGDGSAPQVPSLVGLGAMAAVLAALQRRAGELSPAAGLALEQAEDPLVVFVPGHGQPHGSKAFADLIELMDLSDEGVEHFDYRWVEGTSDARRASRDVLVDDAATALNAYLAGVAGDGRPVYLVGFSKGGAAVAELIADWDEGRWGPSSRVVGAALLDPPLATGPHGWLQSLGRFWGPIPDDGGYNPRRCTFPGFSCFDRRDHLGDEAGIDVVVIRNPKAAVTSFGDRPPGLPVYEAADDGPTIWGQMVRNPFGLPGRIAEAHNAVLEDRRVADCIVAELRSGTCDLPVAAEVRRSDGVGRLEAPSPLPRKALLKRSWHASKPWLHSRAAGALRPGLLS